MPCSSPCGKLLAVLSFLLTSTIAMAQVAGTAALTGTVTDPSGGTVVGAEVTATNLATGVKRSIRTDEVGKYLMAQLPPGDYRVELAATGFKTAVRTNLGLPIGVTSTLDVVLELGNVAESVEDPATFGQYSAMLGGPRRMQVSLRYDF